MSQPLFVLGVSRSGTTLLRVILDRSPGIAIPDESFFVPLLARRHRGTVDVERFLDDVSRIPTIRSWGLSVEEIAPRVPHGSTVGAAIGAIFETYAAMVGKPRWGDKTPMYMRHLPLLERLFPDALYVHLIRDGRNAAISFLEMPEGTFTRTWAHPSTAARFACLWRREVRDARALGRRVGRDRYHEVRYESLVAEPESTVEGICAFAGVPFELQMLEYSRAMDVSGKPHQQRLLQPPTAGVRRWQDDMEHEDVRGFEEIAGDLLAELGYELGSDVRPRQPLRARTARLEYRVRLTAWNAATSAVQLSPLWRRRHPRLQAAASQSPHPGSS